MIAKQADGLTDTSRSVDGAPASLASLGYVDLGIDEGWEGCGEGFNGTQHTIYGWPVVDTTKFPDMNATAAYIHGKGLRAGWYCILKRRYSLCMRLINPPCFSLTPMLCS